MKLRLPAILVAVVAGLALADSSVVALALPPIRVDLGSSINGLAAVIGVYVLVLGLALYPSALLSRHFGAAQTGALGFAILAIASVGCAVSDSLTTLLVFRGLQALGGAAGVLAAFDLLDPGDAEGKEERHLWIAAAVFGTAAGPAVGGILTQALDWRAIFWVQVPIGIAGAIACTQIRIPQPTHHASPFKWRPLISLGLLAGALAAVLFTLVLQLVAGWSVEPIVAALAVSVLPVSAIATSRYTKIPTAPSAALGCGMVGVGALCLIFVPGAGVLWTVPAQALAGVGMGLALPALNGGLLFEKTTADAARLLTARHIGIFVALLILAPIVNNQLTAATTAGQEQGVAALLDSNIPPLSKLGIAPALAKPSASTAPREAIRTALDAKATSFSGNDRVAFDTFAKRTDETVVAAANRAFRPAYIVAGLMALIAALLLCGGAELGMFARYRLPAAAAGLVTLLIYVGIFLVLAPTAVKIGDPCKPRQLPTASGLTGLAQANILNSLDKKACTNGSSREALVIALGSPAAAEQYKAKYGADPGSVSSLLGDQISGFLGGLGGALK